MKTNIKLIVAAISLCFSGTAVAQQFSSSYFMEGSLYRHELNPAFIGTQNYFSMPFLGNVHVSANGNLGVGDILFNKGGKTVTLLHPDVSLNEAMKNLNENNKFLENVSLPVFSVGFSSFGGFNTIGLNVREFAGFRFGDDIFELLKELKNDKSYNIGQIGVQAQAFLELAFGHSRNLKEVDENLNVGAKVKLLFGAARANAELDDLTLNLGTDKWTATAHARGEINAKGIEITQKYEKYNDESKNTKTDPKTGEKYGYETVDELKTNNAGLGGFGLAFDLGAEYDFKDLVPGLKASMSLLDLGFISWSESHVVENNGTPFEFDGFKNIQVKDGAGTPMSDQTDKIKDDLMNLYRMENKGNVGSSTHGIGATMNIGVEYTLPYYEPIRFGLLSTTRFQGDYSWNEERLSVNYAPCNWFEMNINGALGTFGPSFGWMLNLHPVGFNFFIGMDHLKTRVSKDFIPLNSNSDITLGISFPLNAAPKKTYN